MSEQKFIQGAVIMAIVIIFLMPVMVTMFFPKEMGEDDFYTSSSAQRIMDELNHDYENFANANSTTEQPWVLTGIYEPYTGGDYKYTPDNWLYSNKVPSYTPSQYTSPDTISSTYTVNLTTDGSSVYRYSTSQIPDTDPPLYRVTQDGFTNGDLYTYVTMDVNKQSEIFFTESLKKTRGTSFYYEYTGYRYAFQPLSDYYTMGTDGPIKQSAVSTSLSLIWYNFVGNSGISGQLVLTGSDSGVDYITAQEIVTAFNSINNTAKFTMNFNGCDMNVYIRINPYYTSQGWSIEDCYNNGWWSLMVTAITTNASAYTTPSNPINPEEIWETLVDLFTFDMSEYPMSPLMQVFASLTVSICLYSTLLAIAAYNPKLLIIVAAIALIQTIISFMGNLDLDIFDWNFPWD